MEDRLLTESLILSCIYQDLTLIVDTNLHVEDFSDGKTMFYYQLALELSKNIKSLDELSVMSYVSTNGIKDLYKDYGGFESISNLLKLADINNFDSYVDNLKKHMIVENLKEKRNFDVYKEVVYDGSKIIPADLLPTMSASKFHNFIQLIFEDIEVEIGDKDLVFENLSFTDKEIQEKLEGKTVDTSHFDVVLEWEDENEKYKYLQNFKLLNDILGGLQRQNGIHGVMASSGVGKTTICLNIALGLVTTSNEKVLIMSNEQQSSYYKCLLTSIICQNVFKCHTLTRKKITRNKFDTEEEKEVFIKANQFIRDNFDGKIKFLSVNSFNKDASGRIIKKERLKNGFRYAIFDTMKFEGGNGGSSSNIAIELVETSRHLDNIGTKYDIGIIMPMQLLVSSDKISYLTCSALSNSKQIKEVLNSAMLFRRVKKFEFDKTSKYWLSPYVFRKDVTGSYVKKELEIIDPLKNKADKDRRYSKDVIDINKQYVIMHLDKNRNGNDDVLLLLEIDNQSGMVKEKGYCDSIYMGMLAD